MAGEITNTDLLEAANQVIKAINDNVLSCSTTTYASGSCSGTEPPSDAATEGGDPPEGWEDTGETPGQPAYQDRKCSIANALHDTWRQYISLWIVYDVDDYSGGMLIALMTLLGAVTGELALPVIGLVAGIVVGFVAGLGLVIVGGGFDLGDMLTIMDANKNDLVCALYNAGDTEQGIEDYIDVLETGGASAGDILLFRALVVVDFVNYLFFKKDPAVEAAMAGYSGTIDCDGCGICPYWIYLYGSGTYPIPYDTELVVSSEDMGGNQHRISMRVPDPECSCVDFGIEIHSHTSDGDWPGGIMTECPVVTIWRYNVEGYENLVGEYCGWNFHLYSTVAFTVNVTISETCPP